MISPPPPPLQSAAPAPLPFLGDARNIALDVAFNGSGWDGRIPGAKSSRSCESKIPDCILFVADKFKMEMVWGAIEEFRLAKQRSIDMERFKVIATPRTPFGNRDLGPTDLESSFFSPGLSSLDNATHLLNQIPDHLLPDRETLASEISQTRRRSIVLEKRADSHSDSDSGDDDDDERYTDATSTPTSSFFSTASAVTPLRIINPSAFDATATTTPSPTKKKNWWKTVQNAFSADKAPKTPNTLPPQTPPRIVRMDSRLEDPRSTSPPPPNSPKKSPNTAASFFGLVSLNLRLPGLAVSLRTGTNETQFSHLDMQRRLDVAIIDLQLEVIARQCPQAWLDVSKATGKNDNDNDNNNNNFHYEACFSVGDFTARERTPDSSSSSTSLPVLIRATLPNSKNRFTTPTFFTLSISRTITSSMKTTNLRAKIHPLDVAVDYDLIRRCHRLFIPPSAPISMSMAPAKIVKMVKEQKQHNNNTAKASSFNENESLSFTTNAKLLIDVSIGKVTVLIPIDRLVQNCPILKIDLELSAIKKSIVTSVDSENLLESFKPTTSSSDSTTTNYEDNLEQIQFCITQFKIGFGTASPVLIETPMDSQKTHLAMTDNILDWDLVKDPVRVLIKINNKLSSSSSKSKQNTDPPSKDSNPAAYWISDGDNEDDGVESPISVSVSIPPLPILISFDSLFQITWLVGYSLKQTKKDPSSQLVAPNMSLTGLTLISQKNVHKMQLAFSVPSISGE